MQLLLCSQKKRKVHKPANQASNKLPNQMDSPRRLHDINVQQSRKSIYPSTLISTSLIPPFFHSFIFSLSLTHTNTSLSISISLHHMSNSLPVKLTGCLIPHGKRQEEEGGGIRGIIGIVGGVRSACSTTAMRSRGCRQMTSPPPLQLQTWREKNYNNWWEQKWREIVKGDGEGDVWVGDNTVRFMDTDETVRVVLTLAAVIVCVCECE